MAHPEERDCIVAVASICCQHEGIKSDDLRHFFCSVHELLLIKIFSSFHSSAFTPKALTVVSEISKDLEG